MDANNASHDVATAIAKVTRTGSWKRTYMKPDIKRATNGGPTPRSLSVELVVTVEGSSSFSATLLVITLPVSVNRDANEIISSLWDDPLLPLRALLSASAKLLDT